MKRIFACRKYFRSAMLNASLFACLWVLTFLLSIVGAEAATRVIVLTDAAGLGDKAFNDVCWQGVLKAGKDFGVEGVILQSRANRPIISPISPWQPGRQI